MGKVIFWLVVFFAALLVLRLINVSKARDRATRSRSDAKQTPAPMVRCVKCGVFLPRTDARALPDGFHCGQASCAPSGAGKR
ncbi:MAG TPA: PP0621 family protein [Casimicrobiaceae bacterium]|jgi:uncharacterized protein|nr:PP0621 family protein [Casimicrobiaceae bacterium]